MNKVALITGSSRGIGKQIAIKFAKNGYNIVVNYINKNEEVEKTIEELKQFNSGEEWTKLRQHVGFLMSLGQALGYIKFQNAKLSWEPNEEKNYCHQQRVWQRRQIHWENGGTAAGLSVF